MGLLFSVFMIGKIAVIGAWILLLLCTTIIYYEAVKAFKGRKIDWLDIALLVLSVVLVIIAMTIIILFEVLM